MKIFGIVVVSGIITLAVPVLIFIGTALWLGAAIERSERER